MDYMAASWLVHRSPRVYEGTVLTPIGPTVPVYQQGQHDLEPIHGL